MVILIGMFIITHPIRVKNIEPQFNFHFVGETTDIDSALYTDEDLPNLELK